MAKNEKSNTVSLREVSEELGRRLVKLYQSEVFVREGKELCDSLFRTGIEAGALISGIPELTDRRSKIHTANQAILKLDQTIYMANIMLVAGYYRPQQVRSLMDYMWRIIDGLRDLLKRVPEPKRKVHIKYSDGTSADLDANLELQGENPVVASSIDAQSNAYTYPEVDNTQAEEKADEGFSDPVE
jgi:hypothetical protein